MIKRKFELDAEKKISSKAMNPKLEFTLLAITATCIKVLLIPSYHSSDFEVHRNWLAITHSLPFSLWYFDETSPWTLDYPPLFAYFERFLSFFANLVDPKIVDLHQGLNNNSLTVVYFQRGSVIISDLCLFYGVYRLTRFLDCKKRFMIWVLVIFCPGLLIVDHMHFQYNGLLLGMLLTSLSCLVEGNDLMGGIVFAILLCFKHLFAVAAPVYFVYLFRHYCCRGGFFKGFGKLMLMGAAVIGVFAVAFGPVFYYGQIRQVIQRMFPFGRGLCHAYWAPNVWVFYVMLDKELTFVLRKIGFNILAPAASFTGGLVGELSPFAILPQITPLTTFVMVFLSISPCLVKAWRNPRPEMITRWVAYAYTCGFMFGWHVHEKALLHFVIPLAIVAVHSLEDAKHYFLLSIVSCYSLFPLLFKTQEYPIKVLLLLLYSIITWLGFSSHFTKSAVTRTTRKGSYPPTNKGEFFISWVAKSYIFGLLIVEIWGLFLHPYFLGDKLPFVPLMMVSIYSALGTLYSWFWQLKWIIKFS